MYVAFLEFILRLILARGMAHRYDIQRDRVNGNIKHAPDNLIGHLGLHKYG